MADDQAADQDRKGTKTETVVRQYDADGKLVTETTSTVVSYSASADKPWPGGYL
jgi:hypothetical protein